MTADGSERGLTYAEAGVDYTAIDPAKVLAQRAAAGTSGLLDRWGLRAVAASRGESAFVWEEPDAYRAMVVEGLGTKNLVADAFRAHSGRSHYEALAQDTVAMIVNDISVVGAEPQVVTAYWAVGDSAWFDDHARAADLADGWASACALAGATWGGGETPVLSGIVAPGTIDLGGACVGIVRPKDRLCLGDRLATGDAIVLLASSGIHANGLTLARRIAVSLPDGYGTEVGDGVTLGEALLSPTHIYAPVVRDILESGVDVHYMANITGHGWRKLMRARRSLRYVVTEVPPPPPLFPFLIERGGLSDAEAYGNLNMGAGFAVYAPAGDTGAILQAAERNGLRAWVVGHVEEGARAVVLEPLGLTFEGDSLEVRT